MSPRLKEKYNNEIRPALQKDGGYANIMMVPTLTKIVVNTCIKEAITNPKLLTAAANEMAMITGQKANVRKARRSIANFKLREGMPLGVRTTLRGARMWYFLERLNNIAIPRIRDFRGLNPKGFDGRGNYSMGLTEQLLFPEIEYDQIVKVNGMNISFVTTANTDAEGRELLKQLGLPFRS
jgi:large subunit ribosomal protein L5